MNSFGGDFRLERTVLVDPGKSRRLWRVRREGAASTLIPAIILNPGEEFSNPQVRRPSHSDDAIHRAVIWRRLYRPCLFSLRCGPPEFAYPTQGECDLRDSSGRTRSSDA